MPTEMTPDFDEPMELVERRRLRYLEEVERAWIHRHQRLCPHCGKPLEASTPAGVPPPVKDTNIAQESTPSGWRDRPPLA